LEGKEFASGLISLLVGKQILLAKLWEWTKKLTALCEQKQITELSHFSASVIATLFICLDFS